MIIMLESAKHFVLALLRPAAFLSVLILSASASHLPFRIARDGLTGFIDAEYGRVLAEPVYTVTGRWREGRIWVGLPSEDPDRSAGCFLNERAASINDNIYGDLSEILPEIPLPEYQQKVAVIRLDHDIYGYLNLGGVLIGQTSPAGAFMQQTGNLLLVQQDGRFGFIDRNGTTMIDAIFSDATPFRGNRAAAKQDALWGLLDMQGCWLTPQHYEELWWFADESRFWRYRKGALWGILASDGREITEPIFTDLGEWQADTLSSCINGKWGLLSGEGTIQTENKFQILLPAGHNSGYWKAQTEDGFWGLLNADGSWKMAPLFEDLEFLSETLVAARKAGWWGVPGEAGAWLVEPHYQRILPPLFENSNFLLCERNYLWGLVDITSGEEQLPCKFQQIRRWKNLVAVQEREACHLMDYSGRIKLTWEGMLDALAPEEAVTEDVAWLKTAQGIHIISATGEILRKISAEKVSCWAQGLAAVFDGKLWGYINLEGEWLIPPGFDDARPFISDLAPVCSGGKWGMINKDGDYLIEPSFDEIGTFWNGTIPVFMRNTGWGLVSTNGTVLLPPSYEGLEWGARSEDVAPPVYGTLEK